jgi:cytochrome bd-type quinol oxidase subunit 2
VKDGVKQAQDAVRLFRQALMLTLILMPILLIAVVVSAPGRWSAARNVFSSLLFSSLLVVAIIVLTRGIIPDLGESEVNRAATTEVVNSLTQTFFISAVVAFVVSLTGVVLTVGNGRLAQAVMRKTRHQG